MRHRFGDMPSNMLMGWIIPIVLIVIIGLSLYMIAKNKRGDNSNRSNSALEILNERFAKGEIDEEEYNRKKRVLKG